MAELRDMTQDELDAWIPEMLADYIAQRTGAGEDPEQASTNGHTQIGQLFPEGRPAEGQHPMKVLVDGEPVGYLWMGRPFGGAKDTWYVFNVEIDAEHRGKGYGRQAMVSAETWSERNGGTRIALNVFGPNTVARSLYESLGYQPMAIAMFKDLPGRT